MSVRLCAVTFIALTAVVARGAAQPATSGTTPSPGKPAIGPTFPADEKVFTLLAAAQARPIPADASPRRKTRLAQIREGAEFLSWNLGRIQINYFLPGEYPQIFDVIDRTYLLLAESEPGTAEKIAVLEERAAAIKTFEGFADARCTAKKDSPRERNRARFWLRGAEGDLLVFQEQHSRVAPPPPSREAVRPGASEPGGPESEPAIPDDDKVYPLLASKLAAPVPADATPLRKIRLAQLREGRRCIYINRVLVKIVGVYWFYELAPILGMIDRTYLLLAELEPGTAGKISVLEERVTAIKEYEEMIAKRIANWREPPYQQNFVRFSRFRAEADVIALKGRPAPAAMPFPGAGRERVPAPADPAKPRPFPADEKVYPLLAARLAAPVSADATPLQKARFAQLREGGKFLSAAHEQLRKDGYMPWDLFQVLNALDSTYLLVTELDSAPAGKIALLEERVVVLKDYERMTTARVNEGRDPPYMTSFVRLRRLGAEADVILTEEPPAKTGKK